MQAVTPTKSKLILCTDYSPIASIYYSLAEQIPAEYSSASQMALGLPPYASRDDGSVHRPAEISA
jgi:hypothetical protein